MVRLTYKEDEFDDCITITDQLEQLTTSFGSNLVLSPSEDAITIIDELNRQYAIVEMLIGELKTYEDSQDIMDWIERTIGEIQ